MLGGLVMEVLAGHAARSATALEVPSASWENEPPCTAGPSSFLAFPSSTVTYTFSVMN